MADRLKDGCQAAIQVGTSGLTGLEGGLPGWGKEG
jgi:hypothetical protein